MKIRKIRKIIKIASFLLAITLSSQSLTTAFASNNVDASAIDPVQASYGYYVDAYMNNSSANKTPETNPSIGVLSGFLNLWTPGSTWNNGTILNKTILNANIEKVVSITNERTSADESRAYLDDRRNQSYSVISGLDRTQTTFW